MPFVLLTSSIFSRCLCLRPLSPVRVIVFFCVSLVCLFTTSFWLLCVDPVFSSISLFIHTALRIIAPVPNHAHINHHTVIPGIQLVSLLVFLCLSFFGLYFT